MAALRFSSSTAERGRTYETFHGRASIAAIAVAASLVCPSVPQATFPETTPDHHPSLPRRGGRRVALFAIQASGAIDQLTHPHGKNIDD